MHSCIVSYQKILKGGYKRTYQHPIASYFGARGARTRSNVFSDPELEFDENILSNLSKIIQSGRRQHFEVVEINIKKDLIKYYLRVSNQLMAYNQVVIDSKELGESIIMKVFYPDNLWLEASYWEASNRTNLHHKYMNKDELSLVHEACQLPKRTEQQIQMLEKALDITFNDG